MYNVSHVLSIVLPSSSTLWIMIIFLFCCILYTVLSHCIRVVVHEIYVCYKHVVKQMMVRISGINISVVVEEKSNIEDLTRENRTRDEETSTIKSRIKEVNSQILELETS